jgi:hypothetical protein
MGAQHPTESEAMASTTLQERCVILRLDLPGCSPDQRDDYAMDVQDAVDARYPEYGTAIRSLAHPVGLELLFTTEAATTAEVLRQAAAVVEAAENVLPFSFEIGTETRSPKHGELIPAVA